MKPATLKKLHACTDAVKWCEQFTTLEEAWLNCERIDWMIWYYRRCNPDKMICVQIAVEVAERVLHTRKAIGATGEWIKKPTYAYAADAAAYAAYAAAYDDDAAVADAAYACAAFATDAYAAAAERKIQSDIIRKYIPQLPTLQ